MKKLGPARTAALAAIAGACLLAVCRPAAAHADDSSSLLQTYQPVTVMDGVEPFAPTTVRSFAIDTQLETQTAPGVWQVVTTAPSPQDLPTQPTAACTAQSLSPCYRLNQTTCNLADGPAALGCFQAAWQDPQPRSVVYGRAVTRGKATVLQYWYFYYDDLYSYDYPPDALFWQAHEGDWEQVTVVLRDGQPQTVGYSQHCTGERRSWSDVERWQGTTHPVVYVATGSHANLFAPGEHPIAVQCIPPQAIALLQQMGLPLPNDHSHPASTVYGPAGLAGVLPTGITRVSAGYPRFMRYEGIWGSDQLFHAPPPIGTVPSGTSPVTPSRTDAWKHPVNTVDGWPLG
jgi:hypothetical protein